MAAYCFGRSVTVPFDEAVQRVTAALAAEGFGVLTEIDVAATMQRKLGKTMPPYRILGACNPALAHEALKLEDKVGTMLPCNVVVQAAGAGRTEVAAIDPVASMQAIDNPELKRSAQVVAERLSAAIDRL